MLKINSEAKCNQVTHSGDPILVASQIASAAGMIFNAFKNEGEIYGDVFRMTLQKMLSDESPAWEPIEGTVTTITKKSDAPTDQS